MACRGQGAQAIVTPDPSPIDGLLVRHSGSGAECCAILDQLRWAECRPFLNFEDFDQALNSDNVDKSIFIDADNSKKTTAGIRKKKTDLSDLESFPGRSPPSSDNGEADDDDDDAPMGEQWQVAGSSRRGGSRRSSLTSTTSTSLKKHYRAPTSVYATAGAKTMFAHL